ncbi:MAG: MFS transporter [Chloroflexi bacterium]|nr:MFS transporter [Chloroflexota bacterium]
MTNLVLLTIIGFILFMSRGVVGPVSSLYAQELGASYVLLSVLGTTTSVFTVIASYMWGRSSDVMGSRKTFMLGGLGVLAVESTLTAMIPVFAPLLGAVQPFVWLFPLRLLGTIGTAAYSTANLAMLGDLLESHASGRGQRMGWVRGSSSAGFGLMAFTAGKIADTFAINIPYYISAALLALAFVLAVALKEERFKREKAAGSFEWHSAWQAFLARFRDAWAVIAGNDDAFDGDTVSTGPKLPLAPLLISSFLFSLMMGSVYEVWANYMKHEAGFTTTVVTMLWATASTSEFPFMILGGWLSDRVGRLPMLSLGFLGWAIVITGYIVVPVMPWIVVIQLIRGLAFSAVTATAMTYAAEARGRSQRGQVAGLYGAMGGVGSILGAAMGGTLTAWVSFHFMFGVATVAMLAGAVYFAVVEWRRRQTALTAPVQS